MQQITGLIRNPVLLVLIAILFGNSSETGSSVVIGNNDFNSQSLLSPEFRNSSSSISFLNPSRFSMHQSYSVSFTGSGQGSSSSGVYLNTLSYQIANPLTLSMDLGFYSPFYSNVPGLADRTMLSKQGAGTSFVLPRIALEYKPTEHFSLNLGIINGPDAAKAYGYSGYQSPWNRSP